MTNRLTWREEINTHYISEIEAELRISDDLMSFRDSEETNETQVEIVEQDALERRRGTMNYFKEDTF